MANELKNNQKRRQIIAQLRASDEWQYAYQQGLTPGKPPLTSEEEYDLTQQLVAIQPITTGVYVYRKHSDMFVKPSKKQLATGDWDDCVQFTTTSADQREIFLEYNKTKSIISILANNPEFLKQHKEGQMWRQMRDDGLLFNA